MRTKQSPGARFCVPLHPVCAQNKCLISNTDPICTQCSKLRVHPATCVHDFNVGCTNLKAVHSACSPFSRIISVHISFCAIDLNYGCTHFPSSAPGGCTNLNLNFEHWHILVLGAQVSQRISARC